MRENLRCLLYILLVLTREAKSQTQAPCNQPPDAQLAFSFDEGISGTTVPGSSVDGTAINSPTTVNGVKGLAISLNAASDDQYVDLGNQRSSCFGNLNMCSAGLSIAFWVNVYSYFGSNNFIFSFGNNSPGGVAVGFMSTNMGLLTANYITDTMAWSLIHSGPVFTAGEWYHVLYTWTMADGPKLYLNGTEATATVQAMSIPSTPPDNNQDFYIGRPNDMDNFYGKMILDEFYIWESVIEDPAELFDFSNNVFDCSCHEGLMLGESECVDVDECADPTRHVCETDDFCDNTIGSYTCRCPIGFMQTSNNSCIDVDECADPPLHMCQTVERCENTLGSYTCIVTDKCSVANGGCEHVCNNTGGSFLCDCHIGFYLSDNNISCLDTDECGNGIHDCERVDLCTNTYGSFYCTCLQGYGYLNNICQDIDECNDKNGGCEGGCVNLDGSFYCSCAGGFHVSPNEVSCIDIDECSSNICNITQVCTNTPGSFSCSCQPGYHIQNGECIDIDECEIRNGGCEDICTNSEGSFSCGCSEGYLLSNNLVSCLDNSTMVNDTGGGEELVCKCPESGSCSGMNSSLTANLSHQLNLILHLELVWDPAFQDAQSEPFHTLEQILLAQVITKIDIWVKIPLTKTTISFSQATDEQVEALILLNFYKGQTVQRLNQVARAIASAVEEADFRLILKNGWSISISQPMGVLNFTGPHVLTEVDSECFLFNALGYCQGWQCMEATDEVGPFFPSCVYKPSIEENVSPSNLAVTAIALNVVCLVLLIVLFAYTLILSQRLNDRRQFYPRIPYSEFSRWNWPRGSPSNYIFSNRRPNRLYRIERIH